MPWLPPMLTPWQDTSCCLRSPRFPVGSQSGFHMFPKATVPVHIFCKAGSPWGRWQIFGSNRVLLCWTSQVPKCYGLTGKRCKSYVSAADVVFAQGFICEWPQCPAEQNRICCLLTQSSQLFVLPLPSCRAGWLTRQSYCYPKDKWEGICAAPLTMNRNALYKMLLSPLHPCTLSAELLRFLALREIDAKNPRNCSGSRMATLLDWGWRSSKFGSVFLGAWQARFSGIALEGTKINSKPDGHFYVVH